MIYLIMIHHIVFVRVNMVKEIRNNVHILAVLGCSMRFTQVYCST